MKVILDFDDLLFKTKEFFSPLQAIFQDFGISPELFHTTYEEVRRDSNGKDFCYHFDAHIQKLKSHIDFDDQGLLQALPGVFRKASEYLFPDSIDFVKFLKENGCEITILSFGDNEFQREKIEGSGIADYVDRVFITQASKGQFFEDQHFEQGEKVYFFDDRVHFLEDAKKRAPAIITVLVSRPEGRFRDTVSEYCDFQVENLEQAKKIIQ